MDWRSTGFRVGKDRVVRKDLPREVTFEQSPWGDGGVWDYKCKGPGMKMSLEVRPRIRKKVSLEVSEQRRLVSNDLISQRLLGIWLGFYYKFGIELEGFEHRSDTVYFIKDHGLLCGDSALGRGERVESRRLFWKLLQ